MVGLMTIMMMMMIMGMLMRMLVMTMEMLIYHVLKGDVEGLVILLVGDGPFFSRALRGVEGSHLGHERLGPQQRALVGPRGTREP